MKRVVRDEFERRTSTEVHRSSDITGWIAEVLRYRLGAVKYGRMWYVPRTSVVQARRLATVIENAGWGAEWVGSERRKCPIATSESLCDGLLIGLSEEVDVELAGLEERREAVRTNTHGKHAEVGARAAATYVERLRVISERVVAYGALLGEARVATLRERVRLAMVEVSSLVDTGTEQRFALLWEEVERDIALKK